MTLGGFMVLALIAWGGWWFYKNVMSSSGSSSGGSSSTPEPAPLRVIEMPDDAHGAVEQFARLANDTRNMIKRMGGHDPYFDFVSINLKYGADDYSGIAEFKMDFDYSMSDFHKHLFHSELGSGFSVDDDTITYRSHNVCGLRSWCSQGEWLEDAVIATVVNNCADAYKSSGSGGDAGVFINFKFH
ncbi:MAG: hypothetical protein IKK21_01730 [Clostridia bacterium]|nr:hypothetical protein [Clostridia bacterium]